MTTPASSADARADAAAGISAEAVVADVTPTVAAAAADLSTVPTSRCRIPDLLRDTAFRRYWTGQSVSGLGDQISSLALPLIAVLAVHADAQEMGLLGAMTWLPNLLFALHAGVWVDRRTHRRRVMIAADLGRMVLLASIPVAYEFGRLTLPLLFFVAFAAGTLAVLFDLCNAPLFNALVPPDRYVSGNSLVSGSRAMCQMAGPSIGGLLVQLLTAPFAVLADALSFAASAVFLSRISPAEPPPARGSAAGLSSGLRFLAGSAVMRASLAATAWVNFFTLMFSALFVLYATTALHLKPGVLGLVLGAGAVGGLIGAATAGAVTRRIGVGMTFVVGCFLFPAPLLLVPAAHGPLTLVIAMLFGCEFWSGVGVMWLDVAAGSLIAAAIPDEVRSRVWGAYQMVNYGIRPLGSLAGGALAGIVGVRPTLWIAAAGGVATFLWLLPSPVPRMRELPGA